RAHTLRSFPTRRSSDLKRRRGLLDGAPGRAVRGADRGAPRISARIPQRTRPMTSHSPLDLLRQACACGTPEAAKLEIHGTWLVRSEEHTSELQSRFDLV